MWKVKEKEHRDHREDAWWWWFETASIHPRIATYSFSITPIHLLLNSVEISYYREYWLVIKHEI